MKIWWAFPHGQGKPLGLARPSDMPTFSPNLARRLDVNLSAQQYVHVVHVDVALFSTATILVSAATYMLLCVVGVVRS